MGESRQRGDSHCHTSRTLLHDGLTGGSRCITRCGTDPTGLDTTGFHARGIGFIGSAHNHVVIAHATSPRRSSTVAR